LKVPNAPIKLFQERGRFLPDDRARHIRPSELLDCLGDCQSVATKISTPLSVTRVSAVAATYPFSLRICGMTLA